MQYSFSPHVVKYRKGRSQARMQSNLHEKIRELVRGEVLPAEPLMNHTTYRVGGAAEVLVRPATAADATRLLRFAKTSGVPIAVIGAGSNVIAPDEGLAGVVVETKNALAGIAYTGDALVRAGSGVPLVDLARDAARRGLRGLEPISCIPGTVGGAVVMNAGTREGDTASVLERIGVCTSPGRTRIFGAREMGFGYRKSILLGSDWLVLWAEFRLAPGDPQVSLMAIDDQWKERSGKYPLDTPSAGSVFKRPPGDYAGRLIEASGCKGMRVGGAHVSERHANFIVNTGSATASDIMELIARVRKAVYDKTGTYLELEQIPLDVHVPCIKRSPLS
jgi:UDP-N-acetylmuramate dehydrogenase